LTPGCGRRTQPLREASQPPLRAGRALLRLLTEPDPMGADTPQNRSDHRGHRPGQPGDHGSGAVRDTACRRPPGHHRPAPGQRSVPPAGGRLSPARGRVTTPQSRFGSGGRRTVSAELDRRATAQTRAAGQGGQAAGGGRPWAGMKEILLLRQGSAHAPLLHLSTPPTTPTITTGLRGVPPGADDDASRPTRTTPAPQTPPS
jgi:hypothetical protein